MSPEMTLVYAKVLDTTLRKSWEQAVKNGLFKSLRCNCIAPKLLMKPSVTDKGKDVIIAAKNKRIRELEAEVDRLSSILKSFYAKEYEKY